MVVPVAGAAGAAVTGAAASAGFGTGTSILVSTFFVAISWPQAASPSAAARTQDDFKKA